MRFCFIWDLGTTPAPAELRLPPAPAREGTKGFCTLGDPGVTPGPPKSSRQPSPRMELAVPVIAWPLLSCPGRLRAPARTGRG